MLWIHVDEQDYFDDATQRFITVKSESFQIEHSLVSVSKWEAKWKLPFLSKDDKTNEQLLDYIRCMTITSDVDPDIYNHIPNHTQEMINNYVGDNQTATWFSEDSNSKGRKEVITSEVIYYWMFSHGIPMECQNWHLSRLLTLIRVCNIKNQPPKKMGRRSMISQRDALNEMRRAQMNSKG